MNKKEFEKLVRPYIIESPRLKLNTELILRYFEPHSPTKHYDMFTVSELNKLIYVPNIWVEDEGYLIFSDESTMYIYCPKGSDEWYESETTYGWSDDHQWVMRKDSISLMNDGRGWNLGDKEDVLYYMLENLPDLNPINYLNWTIVRNPLNLK